MSKISQNFNESQRQVTEGFRGSRSGLMSHDYSQSSHKNSKSLSFQMVTVVVVPEFKIQTKTAERECRGAWETR